MSERRPFAVRVPFWAVPTTECVSQVAHLWDEDDCPNEWRPVCGVELWSELWSLGRESPHGRDRRCKRCLKWLAARPGRFLELEAEEAPDE